MIKFITSENSEPSATFGQVQENQFFVSMDGSLCQKVSNDCCNIIADPDGKPFCNHDAMDSEDFILRILPLVTKIEF